MKGSSPATDVHAQCNHVMIDTLKVIVPCTPKQEIFGSVIRSINEEGEVVRDTKLPKAVAGRASALRVRTCRLQNRATGQLEWGIEVEGSPAKFLYGHNLFGSSDPVALTVQVMLVLREQMADELLVSDADLARIARGEFEVRRVDLAGMYKFRDDVDPLAWVTAAEYGIRHRRQRPTRVDAALYLQQHSTHWSLKWYLKELELAANPLQEGISDCDGLLAWAARTLRTELVLRRPELRKLGLHDPRNWTPDTAATVFERYRAKPAYLGKVRCLDAIKDMLSRSEEGIYYRWLGQADMRCGMSAATLAKYHRRFMALGIDLLSPPGAEGSTFDVAAIFDAPALGMPDYRESPLLLAGSVTETKSSAPVPFRAFQTDSDAGNDDSARVAA